jgi:hypothetical protein
VETLYYRTEGHGFFDDEHRLDFYTKLLGFLDRNIGGATNATNLGTSAAGSPAGH